MRLSVAKGFYRLLAGTYFIANCMILRRTGAGDLSEQRAVQGQNGRAEIGVIEYVLGFHANFDGLAPGPERSRQAGVDQQHSRTENGARTHVAVGKRRGKGEGRRIDPVRGGSVAVNVRSTCSGRWPPTPVSALSSPVVTVKKRRIAASMPRPASIRSRAPHQVLVNFGTSATPVMFAICRRSVPEVLQLPRSAVPGKCTPRFRRCRHSAAC